MISLGRKKKAGKVEGRGGGYHFITTVPPWKCPTPVLNYTFFVLICLTLL